ncbi:MAG TPA: PmoA family protein [Planctomycetota bacterium]|jgi:hypothetical protein|nr:PmoA family protein [Planctomycetota bacterium]
MLAVLALVLLAQDTPLEFPVPSGFDITKPCRLIRTSDGKEIPCQLNTKRAFTILFVAKNEAAEYRLESAAPTEFPKIDFADDGKALTLRSGEKNILTYHIAAVEQPDPVFSRSGYIHPIWTPAGKVVTNDSPPNHLHHHGIWSAWTSSEFEGRKTNFWESKEKQGRVETREGLKLFSGPVFSGFHSSHRFIALNSPEGPTQVLEEFWEVRAFALPGRFVIDLLSTQMCSTGKPLIIREYRYGGIGFRGPADWEGKEGVEFLTSEGKNRVEGHATRAKWVVAWGKVGGQEASVGFLGHTSNFRDPQPLRIHPSEPFFNWAVPQGGDFSIEPGKPYVARYRFIIADGKLDKESMDRAWTDFNTAPAVRISASK